MGVHAARLEPVTEGKVPIGRLKRSSQPTDSNQSVSRNKRVPKSGQIPERGWKHETDLD
jgi:hypothetical protein